MKRLLLIFMILLTSLTCLAKKSEIDSSKILECRMEINAYSKAIRELKVKRDSTIHELRKAGGTYEPDSTLNTLVGVGIVLIGFACGVVMIIKSR